MWIFVYLWWIYSQFERNPYEGIHLGIFDFFSLNNDKFTFWHRLSKKLVHNDSQNHAEDKMSL